MNKTKWIGWYESNLKRCNIVIFGNTKKEALEDLRKTYPDCIGANGKIKSKEYFPRVLTIPNY